MPGGCGIGRAEGQGRVQGIVAVPADHGDAHRRGDGRARHRRPGEEPNPEGGRRGGVAGPLVRIVVLIDLAELPVRELGAVLAEVREGRGRGNVSGTPGPEAAPVVQEVGPLRKAGVEDELEGHHPGAHGTHGGGPPRGGIRGQIHGRQDSARVGIQGQDRAAQGRRLGGCVREVRLHLGSAEAAPQEDRVAQLAIGVHDPADGGRRRGEPELLEQTLHGGEGRRAGPDLGGREGRSLIRHQRPAEARREGIADIQGVGAAPSLAEAEDGHGALPGPLVHQAVGRPAAAGRQVQVVEGGAAVHQEPVDIAGDRQVVQPVQEVCGQEAPELLDRPGDEAAGLGPGDFAEGVQPALVGAHQDEAEAAAPQGRQVRVFAQGLAHVVPGVFQYRRGGVDDVAHDVRAIGRGLAAAVELGGVGPCRVLDDGLFLVGVHHRGGHKVLQARGRVLEGGAGVREGLQGRAIRDARVERPGGADGPLQEGGARAPHGCGGAQGGGEGPAAVQDLDRAVHLLGPEGQEIPGPQHAAGAGRVELASVELAAQAGPDEGKGRCGGGLGAHGRDGDAEGIFDAAVEALWVRPVEEVDRVVPRQAPRRILGGVFGIGDPVVVRIEGRAEGLVPAQEGVVGAEGSGGEPRAPQEGSQEEAALGARGIRVLASEADAHGHRGHQMIRAEGDPVALP